MSDAFRFETFVDVHSNIFNEYLSSVIAKLSKENEEYQALQDEIESLYGKYPAVLGVCDSEQAAELKTMGSINVRLAKGFDQTIRMSVESVSRPDKGRCAVVLSSTRYLAQTTLLRHQAADAVLHTYEGLRVPADALRVSEDGVTGVYCVDGENAAFRPVTLVYQGEGYALVTPAEGAGDTRTLRAGDQVIATSGQLHDGKVIR